MQEVNLTQQGIPSASHAAAALGWQMLVLPKPHSRRGGVALLARQPLAWWSSLVRRGMRLSPSLLTFLGLQAPLQVTSVYSVRGADSTLLYQETQRAEALSGSPWLLALDGNVPMESGPLAAALQLAGGVLRAVGRHVDTCPAGMPLTVCGRQKRCLRWRVALRSVPERAITHLWSAPLIFGFLRGARSGGWLARLRTSAKRSSSKMCRGRTSLAPHVSGSH